jgi:hypothetical protein
MTAGATLAYRSGARLLPGVAHESPLEICTSPLIQAVGFFLCHGVTLTVMARTHPHAEATYRVILLPGKAFGVEVTIPDTYPTTVSGFATKAAAEAWIAKHKRQVAENDLFRPFGKRFLPRV